MFRNLRILSIENEKDRRFLEQKTNDFNFKEFKLQEINQLINGMRKIMKKAKGIGLSANQVGLPYRLFIVEIPQKNSKKFYAIFNPKIEKTEGEKIELEEGCLSVPNLYGVVGRYPKIVISGFNRYGKPIKIKAWGILAHVFQHEIDHLDGKIFLEKAKKVFDLKNLNIKNLNKNNE